MFMSPSIERKDGGICMRYCKEKKSKGASKSNVRMESDGREDHAQVISRLCPQN